MSLRGLIRRSRHGKMMSELIPHDHQFRSLKLNAPYIDGFIFPYGLATKWLDPLDWCSMNIVLFPLMTLWFLAGSLLLCLGVRSLWVFIPMILFMCVWFFFMLVAADMVGAFSRFFYDLRRHLGARDLEPIYKLSPSQFGDLCIKRLQTLAGELEEVERNTQPFDKKRCKARDKFGEAFDFFKSYGFIRGDWRPFFTQPETQR